MTSPTKVTFVSGADDALRAQTLARIVTDAVGDRDRTRSIERHPLTEHSIELCRTPDLFGERRLLVLEANGTDVTGPVLNYLDDPSPDNDVIIDWGRRAPGKKIRDHAAAATITADVPRNQRGRADAVKEAIAKHDLSLTRAAADTITAQLGEELGRLDTLLSVLAATYDAGQTLDVAEVAPYLGSAGSVPPWDLTDAIDRGDAATALRVTRRLLDSGSHPLQLLAILTTHTRRIFTLAQTGVTDEKQAAKLLGMKGSTFPARKAATAARKLGRDRTTTAMQLIAQAGPQLRGRSALDGHALIERLVARLAHLSRR